MAWQRHDGRSAAQLRPIRFQRDFTRFAEGSVLTECGQTVVLCTVSSQAGVPPFLRDTGSGWLTAEYRMLPGATPNRQRREGMRLSGRTQEIQRLIGRSLRAALDLSALGERTLTVDADVLQADAGTRTTAITGGFVALAIALERLVQRGELAQSPLQTAIAAVSVGMVEGEPLLDLDYTEDNQAEVDLNLAMDGGLKFIEVQGTAESGSYSRAQLDRMLDLGERGIRELLVAQREVLPAGVLPEDATPR